MVPPVFHDYFFASAGAGAALVGLLFVAVSVAPERTVMRGAPIERQAVSTSAYTALLNAFFLSMVALLPGTNLAVTALVLALLSLIDQGRLAWTFLRRAEKGWLSLLRRGALVVLGLLLYGVELFNAIRLVLSPSDTTLVSSLATLVLGIYALGMARAWQLLGARSFRLSDWLSPLQDTEEHPSETSADESRGASVNKGNEAK